MSLTEKFREWARSRIEGRYNKDLKEAEFWSLEVLAEIERRADGNNKWWPSLKEAHEYSNLGRSMRQLQREWFGEK